MPTDLPSAAQTRWRVLEILRGRDLVRATVLLLRHDGRGRMRVDLNSADPADAARLAKFERMLSSGTWVTLAEL